MTKRSMDCDPDCPDCEAERVDPRDGDEPYVMLAVKDHMAGADPHRFEIVAEFGGETHFATKAEADAALDEYSEILETAVDRDLRARCERLERALDETHGLVTNLGARVLRDVAGLDGTDQERVADILRDHVNDVYGRAKATQVGAREGRNDPGRTKP